MTFPFVGAVTSAWMPEMAGATLSMFETVYSAADTLPAASTALKVTVPFAVNSTPSLYSINSPLSFE